MPTEPQPAEEKSLRPRSYGGRRAFFGLLLLALVSFLWWRSYRHGDVMAVFGPAGKIGGVMSHRGQLVVVFTNIDMGAGRAWTIQTIASSPEEGAELRGMLVGDTSSSNVGLLGGNSGGVAIPSNLPAVSQRWGFLVARHEKDAFGMPGKWCSVIAAPHWVLLPLGVWPVVSWSIRRSRVIRRKRRGCCLTCGYDLRGVEGRCPECGTERQAATSAAS